MPRICGMTSVLWRRLDVPGHDSCRVDGFRLEGTAVFEGPAQVRYELTCDERWVSRLGRIQGWIGGESFDVTIKHTDRWLLNGRPVPGLDGCLDLDFGFTPATNFTQLQRVALKVGEATDVNVAWIDVPHARLTFLPQLYERRTEHTYWYESPSTGYAAELSIAENGFTLSYPGLWEQVASRPSASPARTR